MNWKLAIKDQRQMQLKAIQAQLVKTKIIPDWMEVKIIKFCDKYRLDQNSVDLIK